MRIAPAAVALVVAHAAEATRSAPAQAGDGAKKDRGKLEKTEDTVEGGTHWRVETDAGAVHVWVPASYDRATAGTVVYVHGYHTDADGAWKDHDLAKQFRASKQNALFVVPDAPSGNDEEVSWNALTDLRRAVTRANIRLPDGPTIVMGHSGKRAKQHKLIVIGSDTATESKAFTKRYPFAVTRDDMPASSDDFSRREKRAKLLYVRSQYGHMQIVTSGKVIPLLLRLTPLKRVGAPAKTSAAAATE